MLKKPLHTGNIAALAWVAMAADATFAGGVVTTIGMALSGLEVFKKADDKTKTLAESIADEVQNHLDRSHLTPDRKKITVQMLALFTPTQAGLAKGNMMAASIADNMRQQVKDTAKDHAHKTDTALNDYAAILTTMLGPFLEPQNQNDAMLQELLARSDKSGDSERLKDEGITENAIIHLAQRIAGQTDDLGQAWLTLQDAMDTAVRVQQEGRTPSNHGDFVNQVLARVADMAAQGDYDDASQTIAQALAEEEAAHQARQIRLLESGVELARLAGNSANAAELLVQQADLTAGGRAGFQGLRVLQTEYYETGRDKGNALDLAIAIDLARIILARATNAGTRGTAHNDLGIALRTLGARESDPARLEQAVTVFENALQELTRDRVPLDWATAQMNLGNVLATLGQRESDPARLKQAVTAYENALQEWTRDRLPLNWATAQMNLGTALHILGE
ncbi:MAG: hypothetical protein KAT26_08630, partial [Marinosulfonomonas sp.]|nr:hypothetical protein [Marinosulfonomonas sp.]